MKNIKNILSSTRCQEDRYIPDFNELQEVVNHLRTEGKRIILSSGVYDLIHNGHGRYLEQAKSKGDILIVGVDSDELTRVRKGKNRPLVPEDERIEMLLHTRHVDIATMYTPGNDNFKLIEMVQPDAIIISETTKDIKPEMLEQIERFNIEKIVLPSQSHVSSTGRIRDMLITASEDLYIALEKAMSKDIVPIVLEQIQKVFNQVTGRVGGKNE